MTASARFSRPMSVQEAKARHRECSLRPGTHRSGTPRFGTSRTAERVLAAIITVDGPSVRDLAQLLDLAPSTASAAVHHLVRRRLVRTEPGPAQGRRPKPVRVDDRSRRAIGLEIRADGVTGVVMGLSGTVVTGKRVPLPARGTGAVSADAVVDAVGDLVTVLRGRLAPAPVDPLLGIGVALGGHVNRRSGEVLFSPELAWNGYARKRGRPVPLAQRVRDVTRFGRVVVDNDANARGTLLQLYGGGRLDDDPFSVVLVTEEGIGGAHFIGNELYRGSTGRAFEIGHVLTRMTGRRCRCGGRGCLEAMATTGAIVESARTRDLAEARARAAEGSPRAVRAFTRAGEYLGAVLSVVVDLVDTSRIVITGPALTGEGAEEPVLFNADYDRAVRRVLAEHVFGAGAGAEPVRLELVAENGPWGGARGAAALVVHDMIAGDLEF